MPGKIGRPIKDTPKDRVITVRLSEDELSTIDFMAYESDKTRTDVIREAIKVLRNLRR